MIPSHNFIYVVIPAEAGIRGFWMPDQVRHDGIVLQQLINGGVGSASHRRVPAKICGRSA